MAKVVNVNEEVNAEVVNEGYDPDNFVEPECVSSDDATNNGKTGRRIPWKTIGVCALCVLGGVALGGIGAAVIGSKVKIPSGEALQAIQPVKVVVPTGSEVSDAAVQALTDTLQSATTEVGTI